ncbi:hypothetical protein BDZ89DRAFT_499638 [Hymenopellis radicata]|nr:hypothetical protein BDZ89DRAFT_499638 [Hymenopellis radicata]
MPQTVSQCTNCSAFIRRSLHHEEEYQSSVFLERLRTSNFPATDEEISHIRHTILPTVFDDISSIESKLTSLREVITSMEEERERLKNVRQKYNNLISLHRTLPSEIWSEIFMYTLSSALDSNAFNASGIMWRLSHVCQSWRNIALSLRSFWSTMHICLPKEAQQDGDVQRLETVLQRSRQGPLNLFFSDDDFLFFSDDDFDRQAPGPKPSILKRMLEIVFAESYRWRNVRLPECRMYWTILDAPLHHQLPHLESLGLASFVRNPEARAYPVVSTFEGCPRLRELSLSGAIPPLLDLRLPWDQITELDLCCMIVDDEEDRRACLRFIGQCPSLKILGMSGYDSVAEVASAYTPITCSNVWKLHGTTVPVIDALTLPCLREASLEPNDSATHFNILYSFKRLLTRSNSLGALTKLSLINNVLLAPTANPEHSLHSLLSQTHSLAFLDLEIDVVDETDFSDRDQIVAMVHVFRHPDPRRLLYFGPVGSFCFDAQDAVERGRYAQPRQA